MAKISACIVAYCDYEEVCAAVRSILHHTPAPDFALYVVDNGSPDGCGKQLTDTDFGDKRVTVLPLPRNIGFGKGHNTRAGPAGKRCSLHSEPRYPAHRRHPGAHGRLAALRSRGGHGHTAAALPRRAAAASARRKPTPWLLLARQLAPKLGGAFRRADEHYTMQDETLTEPRRIEFCTGSFMAVRTDVLKKIGGFDPAYFMYVEDADLTQKVLREGTVWLAPQFSAIHAWHRAPMRDAGKFKMQLLSMGRYFRKWGCGKGEV